MSLDEDYDPESEPYDYHPEQDDRLPCPTCKAGGFVLEPDQATDVPSTVATVADATSETPRSPYDEEEPYYINAPDHHPDDLEKDMSEPEMIVTTDILAFLEARRDYGVFNGGIHEYSSIFGPAAAEIRRLRARVAELEAENALLREAYDAL